MCLSLPCLILSTGTHFLSGCLPYDNLLPPWKSWSSNARVQESKFILQHLHLSSEMWADGTKQKVCHSNKKYPQCPIVFEICSEWFKMKIGSAQFITCTDFTVMSTHWNNIRTIIYVKSTSFKFIYIMIF